MSSYAKGIYQAAIAKLVAAQAPAGLLARVPAASLFAGLFPEIADLPPGSYPAIAVEPEDDRRKFFTTGQPPAVSSDFLLKVFCLVSEAQPGVGLVGDADNLGLFDLVAAVENVLETDQTLGNTQGVQKVLCVGIQYHYELYPIRMAEVTVKVTGQLTTVSN